MQVNSLNQTQYLNKQTYSNLNRGKSVSFKGSISGFEKAVDYLEKNYANNPEIRSYCASISDIRPRCLQHKEIIENKFSPWFKLSVSCLGDKIYGPTYATDLNMDIPEMPGYKTDTLLESDPTILLSPRYWENIVKPWEYPTKLFEAKRNELRLHEIQHEMVSSAFQDKDIHKRDFLRFLEPALEEVNKEIEWYETHIKEEEYYKHYNNNILLGLKFMKERIEKHIAECNE